MKVLFNRLAIVFALLAVALFFANTYLGVFKEEDHAITESIVLYSGRKDPLILPIIEAFREKTGIDVIIKSGSSSELAQAIIAEGDITEADVYIGTDASWLQSMADAGVLFQLPNDVLTQIPSDLRSKDSTWTGVSGRARVFMVNTDMLNPQDYPTTVLDIINPKYRGIVAMANVSNESVVTHLSALGHTFGDEQVEIILQGLKDNNVTFLKGHTEVRQAVARGEFAIGFVNHYYGHIQQQESSNIEIVYPDQGEGMMGAFVNVAGVAIPSASTNREMAVEFVEFLLSEEGQILFAEVNYEIPLRDGVVVQTVPTLDSFNVMNVTLFEAGARLNTTNEIILRSGL